MKFKVEELMKKRGFETQLSLAEAAGIHPTRIGPIIHGTVRRIDVETLDKLCRSLKCQPNDLIEYIPDP